ncbi:unnamed protein product [Bursaphelenchus okinawaensis]|uniref:Tyrosine-protein kinase n=1 Tax=Bursaphelenchus okinawaensis TaxID=465554 RepID=A0A811LEE2_9BILA|nr:unnamed protein product [Bursaphelenchus okinawaensis]CAG9121496.1 unnamed protein product [Bursaphelenchus okinawaensis]
MAENDKDDQKLEVQTYYHGIRDMEEITSELRHSGDFIVRASMSDGVPRIFLHVRTKKDLQKYMLPVVNNKYCLDVDKQNPFRVSFDAVAELVNYYTGNALPCGQKLIFGVPRPKWLIRHSAIDYYAKDLLGKGNFADVFKGSILLDGVKKFVAIKVCHTSEDKNQQEQEQEACQSMLYEAKIMSKYYHENIIDFIGIACDHPPILIVLEFCPGGSLDLHLRNDKIQICQVELVLYAFEAARGMRYLHAQKCLHRDLASRNCLISSRGQIKIADFGLSQMVDEMNLKKEEKKEEKEKKKANVPLRWLAPEAISRNPVVLLNSDVWSYGVLLYEMFNKGLAVFHDEDDYKKIAKHIRHGDMPKFPESAPELLRKVVTEEIWLIEPEKRTMFDDIVPLLMAYLEEHEKEFPSIENLAVNRIKGVNRTAIFYSSRQELLKRDRYIVVSSRRRRRSVHRSNPSPNQNPTEVSVTRRRSKPRRRSKVTTNNTNNNASCRNQERSDRESDDDGKRTSAEPLSGMERRTKS